MAEQKFEKINYSGSELYLRDQLFQRGIKIPESDEGKLIRKHALQLLRNWEQNYADMAPKRKCRVIFHTSSNPSSGPYVFASVNNKNFQAPYGKEVVIPEYMLRECIDRAQTITYITVKDEYNRDRIEEQRSPLYPYTFLGYVYDELDDATACSDADAAAEAKTAAE